MSITIYCGPMGSGKTFSAVQEVLLPTLKKGRRVVTNITGLDHSKIAAFLDMNVDVIRDNLIIVDDEAVNDSLWPDEDQNGIIPWGSVLVLDEAWKWLRDKEQLTPRFWSYLRKHRKWAAGDPPANCEIVLITQSKTDLPRSIMNVVDQIWQVKKNLFSGAMSFYQLTLYQPGQRKPLLHKNLKYNKKIFGLYKSHAVDGVVEVRANEGGSWLHDRKTYIGAAALVVALIGVAWMVPALLTGKLMPKPRVKAPAAVPNTVVVSDPTVIPVRSAPTSTVALSSSANMPGVSPAMPSPAAPGAPLGGNITSRVLKLTGDPQAAKDVGDAFCARSGDCQTVVNAGSQQIVIVGSETAVDRLQKLLNSLAVRPPAQLVHVVLFEADDTAADDLNFYVGMTGSVAFNAGHTVGAGVAGSVSIGSFTAAFNKLNGAGNVRVLSSPSVSVWPGQTATVKSGLSVPILGSIITDSAGRQSQVLDYRDSGLILNLMQVSAGDRPVLKMDIESSSYGDTQVGVSGQPSKTQRIMSSMVELPACQVVVLGGLDQLYDNQQIQKLLGLTLTKTKSTKASHMYVALFGEPQSSAHACAAQGSSESATTKPSL